MKLIFHINYLKRKLTDTQVLKIRKAIANGSSTNTKFSGTQLPKIGQLRGFLFGSPKILGPPLPPLKEMTSLVNSIIKLNNGVFVDTGLEKNGKKIEKWISSITGSGITLTNNETKDIKKVIKPVENTGILLNVTRRRISRFS